MRTRLLHLFSILAATALHAQLSPLAPIPSIPFDTSGPVLRADTQPQRPFTVAGEHGALVGQQDGTLEAWVLPVKLFSHLTIEANIADYPVPIDVNQHAAAIEVRPDRTIITYAHLGFTVRQIMFSPSGPPSKAGWQTGPVILYQFDCLHPTDFTFRFTPELQFMWPAHNEGVPGIEWDTHAFRANPPSSGLYILHSDYPDLAAAITIPGAEPGILTPYQERPQVHPVELRLHIDPARDHDRLFPLLMAVGTDTASASTPALAAALEHLNTDLPSLYAAHAQHYKDLLAKSVSIETPDKSLDEAFQWAVISIEQLKTSVFEPNGCSPLTTDHCSLTTSPGETPGSPRTPSGNETALVAGYLASADSTRPGYGWFFGRDALYTLYAVNGFGDFALTRAELEFLIRRQRDDGKIMHEYSQTAPLFDWRAFPYMYAAADSTPLFLMAMADYARASGDTAFLTAHRDAIEKAWAFETDPAHDTDHDGIYDNSQGTGWVESWPGGMPHQEIYLALLDQQASSAYGYIEDQLHDSARAQSARTRASSLAKTINTEYYDQEKGCYAFATDPPGVPTAGTLPGQTNANSPIDRTTTIYPALAWWDPAVGKSILDHSEACLRQFIGSALNTDWGTRDIANTEKIYDGMSYHQGSVWPLFTGWAALAEYRGNQPLAGYQLLKENANLTRAQDLGAVTELLSGDFFVPFGRSTSHQLWSSAMVITPTLRGLFGISIDAQSKTITVNPHLPANWDHAKIKNLHVGNETVDLEFARDKGAGLIVHRSPVQSDITLQSIGKVARIGSTALVIPDPAVQIAPDIQSPNPGNRAQYPRIVEEQYSDRKLTVAIEGLAATEAQFPMIISTPRLKLHAEGADLVTNSPSQNLPPMPGIPVQAKSTNSKPLPEPSAITVHFPPGEGWQTITVTLTW
jgi:glycogen debranching enzyme